MSAEANKALVRRFLEQLDSGNVDVFDEVCTTDYVCHYPKTVSPKPLTRDEHKQFVLANAEAFPRMQHTIHDLIAEDDRVMWRVTVKGSHAPTGKPAELSAIGTGRVRDGRLAEVWVEGDFSGLMQEVGAALEQPAS